MYGIYLAPKLHAKPEDLHLEELQALAIIGIAFVLQGAQAGMEACRRVWGLARSPYILGANNVLKPGTRTNTQPETPMPKETRGGEPSKGPRNLRQSPCSIERMQLWGMGAGPQEGS